MKISKFNGVDTADRKNGVMHDQFASGWQLIGGALCHGALCRREAAQYLGISTRMLDQLASDGRLARAKIGAKTVFLVSDLHHFLNSCRITNNK